MRRRAGLSRAEVLVVLLLVLGLVGMVLVGIGKIRGAADQQKCRNNLKQVGLAVHGYFDTSGQLPLLADQGEWALAGRGLPSVLALIIPYLEGTPLAFRPERSPDYYHAHSSVQFTYPHKGMPFTQVGGMANHVIPIFLDPADATAKQLRDIPMTLPDGSTGYYATGSYAANGLAPWGKRSGRLQQLFPNGIENTILIGERPQVCRTGAGDEVYNLWGLGFYSPDMPAFATLTPADPPGLLSTGQVAPVVPLPDEGSPIPVRIGRRDAEPELPDFPTPVQRVRPGRPCDPRLPGGPHLAGLQVLMADGSVRVFGWDTSPRVFWAACLPGEPASGPSP